MAILDTIQPCHTWVQDEIQGRVSCIPTETEDCSPILLSQYCSLRDLPSPNDPKSEGFSSGSSLSSPIVIGLIIGIVVVVLIMIILWVLSRRAARRAREKQTEEDALAERQREEDQALQDELAAADDQPEEIVVVQEKRPYVVGYGKSKQYRHSERTGIVSDDRDSTRPPIFDNSRKQPSGYVV